ncbi:hypothetical protein An15g06090 [Aspergillus niger]|uniref:Uncharacterized protein n=2 Tax=Aspergillus niger TaxID=5061 RepID=A2R5Z5_ASPNC|nr:hypothetical protein An15g06090 [Aspergillus niger]CAK42562.1 hypothetical protein An15g06090 [Aspergillus niger]
MESDAFRDGCIPINYPLYPTVLMWETSVSSRFEAANQGYDITYIDHSLLCRYDQISRGPPHQPLCSIAPLNLQRARYDIAPDYEASPKIEWSPKLISQLCIGITPIVPAKKRIDKGDMESKNMTLKTSERINVEANRSELCRQLTTPIKTVVYLAKEGECDPGKKRK